MSATPITPTALTNELLDDCERTLGYQFQDRSLLRCALTHASAARTRLESNERLEFLGDSLLGAVVCEHLFSAFPDSPEGELTQIKSAVVSRATCARVTRSLQLQQFLVAGKGVVLQRGTPHSILAAQFEAVVAAIYLDGGFEPMREFVNREMGAEIAHAAQTAHGVNFKSVLQQQAQSTSGDTPVYVVLDEQGPDHSKCFQVAAVIGRRQFDPAWGPSKKEAEQRAAQIALAQLADQPLPVADQPLPE
jgi:ribonuclease III